MAWSLMNHMIADKVETLLDEKREAYPPDVVRFFSREKALSIIHAAIWGYSVREDSTAGAYAFMNLMHALGIKQWTFDADEAAQFQALREKINREKYAELDATNSKAQGSAGHSGATENTGSASTDAAVRPANSDL